MTGILVLRLVHVLGGMFWVGGGLFAGLFLMPALTAAGPAAAPVFGEMQRRRRFLVVPTVAVLTILSGLRLLWLVSGGFAPAYFATPSGATFAASGAAAVAAFFLVILARGPAQGRGAILARRVATGLLVLSAAGMAVGRYAAWAG